jgi:hypothetical protein
MPRFFTRPRVGVRLTAAAAVALLAVGGAAAVAVEIGAHADETTVSTDIARTGWDQNEPALSPSQVTSANFGQLFSTSVDGQVYAQPVVVGSTVIVATENNNVYGLNSATGAVKWTVNLGPAWPASAIGCGDLSPNVGVTSTPVYDPDTGYVYLTAKVNDGADAQHPHYYMHALDPATGTEETGWPVTIAGSASNDRGYAFNPFTQLQRPGLLLMGGSVYAAFSAHCDLGTYAGFVAGVNTSTEAISMWTDEPVPASNGGGIWQSGGGLVSDGPGRIFAVTGNGVSPGTAAGSSPPSELAQSVVRLGVAADGTMSAQDFFSPANAATLNTNDQDLGSGGPVALPDSFGTSSYPHLMVQAGKDGRVFLLNRDDLGGSGQGSAGGDAVLGTTGPVEGVWGHPAVWGGDGGYVYLDGSGGPLRALQYGVTGAGMPALSLAGNSDQYFSYTSGSPVVTSSGTTSGSAVVWVVQVTSGSGANGELLAFNALPVNGKLQLLRSFPIGTGAKFSVPATDSGRVYVGTRDGHVFGFGAPVPAPLTAAPLDFGSVNVGSTASATMTMTAATAVTVSAVTVPAPFTVTPGTLPVSLTAGQTLSLPVTFSPTAIGAALGTLTVTTDSTTVTANLNGTGAENGFHANLSTVGFGTVPVGLTKTLSVSFANTGTTPETVSGVTAPTGAFTASGLPAIGSAVNPGVSVVVPVTYTPTAATTDSSTIAVTGPDGTATVTLTATAVAGTGQVTVTPMSLSFGQVTVGKTVSKTFTVSDTGNLPLTITKAASPAAPFIVPSPISEGLAMSPGTSLTTTVTFTPTAAGSFSDNYEVSTDTGQGAMEVALTGTAVKPAASPTTHTLAAPGGSGWKYNGSAAMYGKDLVLTLAAKSKTGTAFDSTVVPTAKLNATFTAKIGGGAGGDGECFVILDATKAKPAAVGMGGAALGFKNLPGVAVCLQTVKVTGDVSNNFVGISTGGTSGRLVYLVASKAIGALRTGTHLVNVTIGTPGHLVVTVDGKKIFNTAVKIPAKAYAGFSGATGSLTDIHLVRAVKITYSS